MINILSFSNKTLITDIEIGDIASLLKKKDNLLWVNIVDEPDENVKPVLADIFKFHPLAVDDALEESHVPKIDDWRDYLYIVLHAVDFNPKSDEPLETRELDIFVGPNYLVTYHCKPVLSIQRMWETCLADDHHLRQGIGHLLYWLVDELVADYFPVIESIDEAVDTLEDDIFVDPRQPLLEQIFTLKRSTLHLRRIIAPQREVLNKLARGDYAVIDNTIKIYFRDVYDHLVRLYDITEGLRDLVSGALDTYLSVVNNRMNDVMKTLTIITTLLMPLSFLTGFFGMNFFQPVVMLTTWTGKTVFIIILAAMVGIPIGMFFWMRKRAWM